MGLVLFLPEAMHRVGIEIRVFVTGIFLKLFANCMKLKFSNL